MSQIEKLKTRFSVCPPDFTWDELVRLLKQVGYVEKTGAGSRRKFRCKGRAAINLHQPHPGRPTLAGL